MSYDELKAICKMSWEEEYRYPCIDGSKKKEIKGDIVLVLKARTRKQNAHLKRNLFD